MATSLVPSSAFTELLWKFTAGSLTLILLSISWNIVHQLFVKNPHEPPIVFHWLPVIGSTVTYGIDPFKFFLQCQAKYGDIFTFVLLGKKTTVYLGTKGNHFILNAKLKDANAEEVYAVLTTPVFGSDVIYDCPNSKLMEQKKFIKFGLSSEALRSYVPLMENEVSQFLSRTPVFRSASGTVDIAKIMAQITLFTASRSLQGKEIREKLDTTFAKVYHDLDDGFTPLNFMLPWAPLPQNRRRDAAQKKMTQIYADIIRERRAQPGGSDSKDMMWNLMNSVYKDGTPVPDHEIAHMMTALLMAGQHSSSVTSAWTILRLASKPEITEELYQEQRQVLGDKIDGLKFEDLQQLPLHANVVRETLRLNPPIHSIMRKAKNTLPIDGTSWVIPAGHVLLAAPGTMSYSSALFPDPDNWDPHRWDKVSDTAEDEKDKVDYGFGPVSTGATSTYLPFGAGRHRCIGEAFAYLQLTLIVAIMVREFKFKNLPGDTGVVETDYSSLFSRPKWPANIQWEKRRASESDHGYNLN